jgi:hypothetical protein
MPAAYQPFPSVADWVASPHVAADFDAALAELDARVPKDQVLLALGADALAAEEDLDGERDAGALHHIVEVATGRLPISETTIRALHEHACAEQEDYGIRRDGELRLLPLVKGTWKRYPNHSIDRQHVYAPVDRIPAEIERFVEQLGSPAFVTAHPVAQASYALYALNCIHPFADGNGRVARALAAICLERSTGRPLPIEFPPKSHYLDALAAADDGRYELLVRFVAERAAATIRSLLSRFGTGTTT